MVLLNIAGACLDFVWRRFLRKDSTACWPRLHGWLERMARRPASAAVAGFAFGTIAPSSPPDFAHAATAARGKLSTDPPLVSFGRQRRIT